MDNISQETHEALVRKAVDDATKALDAALATKTDELASEKAKVGELETANTALKSDNDRLNTELDSAQVKLTAATEEVSSLKKDIAEAEEAAQVAEIASKRVEQVKNLKLFTDEFVTTERANRWAGLTDEAWGEQLEEWKQLKPAASAGEGDGTDTASAMSGTSDLTKDQKDDTAAGGADNKQSSRRAVLAMR
jgi:regulator of replication initiation timing